jgi:hypothetical protein
MIHAEQRRLVVGLHVFMSLGFIGWSVSSAFGFQRMYDMPATHERQCVPTGEIAPGDARTITVTWTHPFATGEYNIIGAVSEPGDSSQAIELGHIVIPHTPTTAAAVVYNRNAKGTQSGVLCLDASAQ